MSDFKDSSPSSSSSSSSFAPSSSSRLTVVSWNVLGDCYALGQDNAQSMRQEILLWEHRSEKIANILQAMQADVYFLQEVDHYLDFYEPLFRESFGYLTLYVSRPVMLSLSRV